MGVPSAPNSPVQAARVPLLNHPRRATCRRRVMGPSVRHRQGEARLDIEYFPFTSPPELLFIVCQSRHPQKVASNPYPPVHPSPPPAPLPNPPFPLSLGIMIVSLLDHITHQLPSINFTWAPTPPTHSVEKVPRFQCLIVEGWTFVKKGPS